MSYCRFSSDYGKSDVYVYEDVGGGWTTHVASNRHVFKSPAPNPIPFGEPGWMERHQTVMKMLEEAGIVPIGLEYDGKHYNDPTPLDAANRLLMLREAGYYVPQYAIDALMEENDSEGERSGD